MASNSAFRRWTGIACVLLAASAGADDLSAWRERDQLRAHFELLPERDLERQFLRCSRESSERLLGFGEAAVCSIGFEALKKRKFGGDFEAMLAWWRLHRDDRSLGGTGP
jgi:hypothetical protein